MRRTWLLALATGLVGCGNVKPMGSPDAGADAVPADAANPCAPAQCLLFDDFNGAALNTALWTVNVGGGATVTQTDGALKIHLPAAIDAFADVYSVTGFDAGTALEASATFTAGQFYDHKGVGFASSAIGNQCDVGESDAAMFRGQDADSYIETKAAAAYSCVRTAMAYPSGANKLQIARSLDKVEFRQNDVMIAPVTSNLPSGLLPVRFSAYTYTIAPTLPVEIVVDYVFVKRQ